VSSIAPQETTLPQQKLSIILNPGAGKKGGNPDQLRSLFQKYGINPSILVVSKGTDLRNLALEAVRKGDKIIVAGGGDGTVNAVSSALAGTDSVLGLLPLGTLNHFAKDIGMPVEIPEAVQIIARQYVSSVDVGQVNERTFVNNSSLGIYPSIVSERERLQRTGFQKWVALLVASFKVFPRLPRITVRLKVDEKSLVRTTHFVFVGNNEYEIAGTKLGTRRCLDASTLVLYIAGTQSRKDLVRLALRTFIGRHSWDEFEIIRTQELWIESKRPHLHVSFDGEVAKMKTPLHYRILPRALRVIVPRPSRVEELK
jgi:diacylglycerol kinase family enzyme